MYVEFIEVKNALCSFASCQMPGAGSQKRIVQFHVVLNAGCRQYNFVEHYQTPRTHLLMLKLVSCISFSFRITLV